MVAIRVGASAFMAMGRGIKTNRQPQQCGFSLLELMVVVIILGVLVSIFTLSVGSFSDDQTSEHARRLQALIDLAAEEATMQGREIGLRFYQHSYEFSMRVPEFDEDGVQTWVWLPLINDRLLKPRELGEEYAIDLLIESKEIDLDYAAGELKEGEVYEPQIYIFSSGDLAPPFSARLRAIYSDDALLVTADAEGKTEISQDDF